MGNPTIRALEDSVAQLENGFAGLATFTGMAAVATVFMAFLGKDLHLVSTDSVYGPSRVVVEKDFSRFGVESSFVDTSDPESVERAMRPNTRLLFIETPANPTIKLSDIAACAAIAHRHEALLVVDNTFMSPYLQRPFEMGADIVLHSMTKFLNGHSDVVAGMIVPRDESLYARIYKTLIYLGGTMDPHQAYLVLRGIKTLPLRMEKSQENAARVAEYLEGHEKVEWVRYPGLKSHPQFDLASRQMKGPGALLSFEVRGGLEAGRKLLDSVRVPVLAVSLGGVESLIQHPASMTHAAMSPEARERARITDGLVRLSVGCEDYEDIREDLERALGEIG
jgi:methionine-gamma-lyase